MLSLTSGGPASRSRTDTPGSSVNRAASTHPADPAPTMTQSYMARYYARSMALAIRLSGVVKRFGSLTAVDGLDLSVPEGTCVGLLGPNGAGKSTTMRLLTAQAIADEGELTVLGY